MGLPFVRPYLSGRTAEDFASGANFAVGGAMALAPDFFRGKGVPMGDRMHLGIEMKWFHDMLDLLCPGNRTDRINQFKKANILIGEILFLILCSCVVMGPQMNICLLEKLRKLHSGVSIIYADYYGAAMEVYRSPEQFGIKYPLEACCGGGGPYGVSTTGGCGYGQYKTCDDPQKYGSWDGFHPSEAAYKGIAIGLLRGTYTQPSIATTISSCPQLTELGSSIEYKVLYDL
uniref:Uncharacterized protein n=1 Tax=Avena sativa TaxID=4498 RepID=A0ACD5VHS9_AVESA